MPDNIFLPEGGHIRIDTVVYCSGEDGPCTVYLNNGNVHTVNETIDTIQQKLPGHQFVRLHPSRIVNIDFINRYIAGPPAQVILHDGTQITIPAAWKKRHDKLLNSL